MQKTLKRINELLELGIITNYAIAGGMAQFYYIEPSITYDLDIVVHISDEEKTLTPLTKIYKWAEKNGYLTEKEHIIIESIPVQFLLAYNELVKEALNNADNIKLFDENTFIFKPEYLMAIMLQTGRLTDKERLARFFIEAEYDKNKFLEIIKRFNLFEVYKKLIEVKNG